MPGCRHNVYTVGYILSSILNHSTLSSSPGCLPTYTVPETCLRSGPWVVVNLADCTLSGRREFLRFARSAVAAALSSAFVSSFADFSRPYSAMIWSAVFRRSEDLMGAKGLTWTLR